MAGLFPSICGAQNVDQNGQPLINAVLTVYVGGTTTLASVFQDIGLAIPGQNPMTADITGRLPFFYVTDGSYKVTLVDQFGKQIYTYPQIASIGASSSGGGGSAVDPTTIFQTGDDLWHEIGGIRTGWVRQNALTIGSAVSGASERANNDTQNLFLYLWNNYPNSKCPVVGGRGASASADWAANKQMTLPDKRGITPQGKDGMGNARLNRIPDSVVTSITSGVPDTGDTDAAIGGAATVGILLANLPSWTLSFAGTTQTWNTNQNDIDFGVGATAVPGGGVVDGIGGQGTASVTVTPSGTIGGSAAAGGSNVSLNVMNPFALGTWYKKL